MRALLVSVLLTACATAPAASPARDAAPAPAPSSSGSTDPGGPAAPTTGPSAPDAASEPPSAWRACLAPPVTVDPASAPRPLPGSTAAWLADIDAAAPALGPGGPTLRVRLRPDDARATSAPEEDMRFTAARTFFEHQHWSEAGLRFRALAMRSPPGSTGIFAAQLYLECLNVVYARGRPRRPTCLDALAEDARALSAIHCAGGAPPHAEACDVLAKIPAQAEALREGR